MVLAQAVHLAWDPAVAHGIGYHVYRSDKAGGPYTRLTSSPVQSLFYSDTTAAGGAMIVTASASLPRFRYSRP